MEISNSTFEYEELRPRVDTSVHPIVQGDYLLDTVAINNLLDTVTGWIFLRNTGAIIYGAPRLGKTRAIRYMRKYFNYKYKDQWCSYFILTKHTKTPNEDRFFSNLLKNVGHALYDTGKAHAKRERLINFLIDKGINTIRKQIVLFIDDAHRYSSLEYEWMMDIYNELDRHGITLTTLLIGQSELAHRRSLYISTEKQIVGRFMVQEKRFYGMKNSYELAYLLSSYDNVTEYPEGSGWSYTRFFFPKAFSNGMRLESESSEIWKTIIELRSKEGIIRTVEIPMHYIISIINYVLLRFGANEENAEWPTINMWKEAIEGSGYLQSEVIYTEKRE